MKIKMTARDRSIGYDESSGQELNIPHLRGATDASLQKEPIGHAIFVVRSGQ